MKKRMLRLICIVLSIAMLVPSVSMIANAAVKTVNDPEEKAELLTKFNTAVNALKTEKPSMKMTSYMGLYEATTGAKEVGEELSDGAKKYLAWLIDSCVVPGTGLLETLSNTINDVPRLPTEASMDYGEKRDNRLPLSGKKYVSALRSSDKFTLKTERSGGTILDPKDEKTVIRIEFPNVTIENSPSSSLSKIFDLPSTSFDPVIIGGDPSKEDADGLLSDITFDEFTFENAYAQAIFDSKGSLIDYFTSIDYTFELSAYDVIRIAGAYANFDFATFAINLANAIFTIQGKEEQGKDILKNYVIYVTYRSEVHVNEINGARRYFGDIDGDGKITSNDARLVLRHSIGFEDDEYINQMNEIYSDVDFDGEVSAADARYVLRAAVGLEPKFKNIPEGKSIKIVFTGDVLTPDEPDDEDNPGDPFETPEQPSSGNVAGDIGGVVISSTDAIKDLIDYFKNSEDKPGASDIIGMLGELIGNLGNKT